MSTGFFPVFIPDAQAATEAALDENPANSGQLQPQSGDTGFSPDTARLWKPGRTLRISLRGGSAYVRSKVKQYASVWTEHANILFQFVDQEPAEIRVAFIDNNRSYSYLGTDALTVPSKYHTMNFGWFNDVTPESEFSRTVIQQFGYALGCIQEQSLPNANLEWNKDNVYKYYKEIGWTSAEVDANVFYKYDSVGVMSSDYDTSSIMHYSIPSGCTTNGVVVGWNSTLSQKDIELIKRLYPNSFAPTSAKLETGTFNTMEVRPWQKPQAHNVGTVQLTLSNTSPPNILLGLNWLDMNILRIKSHVLDVTTNSVKIDLESWGDTVQSSAGCSWLSIPKDDPDLQFGHFNTMDDHPWTQPKKSTTRTISFARPYSAPPNVVVWLESGDTGGAQNCRIVTKAENVTANGFTIHIDTWSDTKIWSSGASWFAYSAGRKDIRSGTFGTDDVRAWNRPRLENNARITFGGGCFSKAPRVFAALNKLDIERGHNIRIKLTTSDVSTSGMTWHLDSWGDTIQYSVGASYIVFDQ